MLTLLCVFMLSAVHAGETLTGRVVAVSDGDTLTLLDAQLVQHKVRLSGIDAPEKRQDWGERAKLSLSFLAFGRQAHAQCPKRDRYARAVCVVTVAGQDVGLEQLRAGLAWFYRKYAKDQAMQEREDYARAEETARKNRLGLWSGRDPMPPWDWRRRKS